MPNKVSPEIEEQILNFMKKYPTYRPKRTEAELKSAGISVSYTCISTGSLRGKGLNKAKARLEWVRKLSEEVVTQDKITRGNKEKAKKNHTETNCLGQLISEDTFYIGCLKGRGKIYPQVGCDCFSFFGAVKVYDNKTTDASTDFVENHLLKKCAPVKIERILTDCRTEFTT